VPERFDPRNGLTPSAEVFTSLSRVLKFLAVHLPESFRGGCSFGAFYKISPEKKLARDIIRRLLEESIKVII